MELVELFQQRESSHTLSHLTRPADRQSSNLRELNRQALEKQGKRVPKAAKRRVSAATRIGSYTPPPDLPRVSTDLGVHVFSVAIHHPELDERGNSSGEPLIACGCSDGNIHMLSLLSGPGERLRVIKAVHSDAVTCLQIFQPDKTALLVVVSGSRDTTVCITIAESGKVVASLRGGHRSDVWCLEVLAQPDLDPLVISGGLDGNICIWSMTEHTLLNTLSADAGPIYCLSVIAHSEVIDACPLVFAGSRDKKVRMWSLASGTVLQEYTGHADRVTCLAVLSPPNALIRYKELTALDKMQQALQARLVKATKLFNSGKARTTQKLSAEDQDLADFMEIHRAMQDDLNVLSRDVFVVSGCEDGVVRVFHALSGTIVRSLCSEDRSPIYAIALTIKDMQPNVIDTEPILAISSKAGKVQLWHLDTGRLLRSLHPHDAPVLCMAMATGAAKTRPTSSAIRSASATAETAAGGDKAAPEAAPSMYRQLPVIVTGSADKTVKICFLNPFLDEAIAAYELDQKERLPRAIMQTVPDKFSQWPRIFLLAEKFGTMDEFFAADNFRLFQYAMADERLDFLSTFLPHASTGLLIASRKAAVARTHAECIRMQQEREHISAAQKLGGATVSWYSPRKYLPKWLIGLMELPWLIRKIHKLNKLMQTDKSLPCHDESLLFQAVAKRDALVVRVILEAWRGLVMEPPRDLLDQTAGPAMCLSKSDLVRVAAVFPAEFENYICSLALVQVHSSISLRCTQTLLPHKSTKEAAGKGSFLEDENIWNKMNSASQESLTCLYLPLRQAADPEMVLAYIQASERLHSVKIFFSEVGMASNHYSWGKHGMKIHRVGALWYLFDCLCFVAFVVTSGTDGILFSVKQITVYFLSTYIAGRFMTVMQQLAYEARLSGRVDPATAEGEGEGEAPAPLSLWRVLGHVSAWGVYEIVWYSLRTAASYSSRINPVLYSLCSLVQWGKLLYYFRAFESTGLLIAMILQIVGEIRFYIFVIFIIFFFFSQALWVLNSNDLSHALQTLGDDGNGHDDATRYAAVGNAFGNQRSSLLTAFTFMFGSFQPAFFRHLSNEYIRRWSIFVSILFMLTVCVVMFNLLIAFMSDIFVRMSQRGVAQWRLMQAKTMHESGFEIASLYHGVDEMHFVSPKLIHVLKRTSDINMDRLKQSFEGTDDSESIAERIIRVADQVSGETTSKIVAQERVVLDRLQAQQAQLADMLRKIEELTATPNAARTDTARL